MNVSIVKTLRTKLADMISKLPDDIKKKIYEEYFELTIKYEKIMKIFYLQNRKGTAAGIKILARTIKNAIKDDKLIELLLQKSKSFNSIYLIKGQDFVYYTDEYENLAIRWVWREFH
jgi:hypothetical protein